MFKFGVSLLSLLFGLSLSAQTYYVFVGAYVPDQPDQGIRVYVLDTVSGQLQPKSLLPHLVNPSYLNLSPNGKYLYACTEARTPKDGNVSSFAFDSLSGKLTFLNKQKSGGENPVYVSVHPSGQWVVNANYTEASVALFRVNSDGSLNPAQQVFRYQTGSNVVKDRQAAAHTHAAYFSPQSDYVLVPDLGADLIRTYRFDPRADSVLSETKPVGQSTAAGHGPRHLAFHPRLKTVYCIEELSGSIAAFRYKKGRLSPLQTINTHPASLTSGFGSADIHVAPDGRFLYASNRGTENNIAIFQIHPRKGTLTHLAYETGGINHPRNFTIDPSGKFLLLASMLNNSILVYRRDVQTGLLTKLSTVEGIPSPSCIKVRRYEK